MSQQEQIETFSREVFKLVNEYSEQGLSIAAAIGVLEMAKLSLFDNLMKSPAVEAPDHEQ